MLGLVHKLWHTVTVIFRLWIYTWWVFALLLCEITRTIWISTSPLASTNVSSIALVFQIYHTSGEPLALGMIKTRYSGRFSCGGQDALYCTVCEDLHIWPKYWNSDRFCRFSSNQGGILVLMRLLFRSQVLKASLCKVLEICTLLAACVRKSSSLNTLI